MYVPQGVPAAAGLQNYVLSWGVLLSPLSDYHPLRLTAVRRPQRVDGVKYYKCEFLDEP